MTKRWRVPAILLMLLFLSYVFVNSTSRLVVLGWLRGEAFYQGRPTGWWIRELRDWDMPFQEYAYFKALYLARNKDGYHVGLNHGVMRRAYWLRELSPVEEFLVKHGNVQSSSQRPTPFADCDPNAIPVLAQLLQTEETRVQFAAVEALAKLGPAGRQAFPDMLEFFRRQRDPQVRFRRGKYIESFGKPSPNFEEESKAFLYRETLVALHAIDPDAARIAGVPLPDSLDTHD